MGCGFSFMLIAKVAIGFSRSATLIFSLTCLLACEVEKSSDYRLHFSPSSPVTKTDYIFGIHPLHNPQRLFEIFNPYMQYLSDNIEGVSFSLEASRNYEAFDEKLYSGKLDFALPNPFQTFNAMSKGYRVFAKMGDDENFKGIILTRRDGGIEKVTDLKGKAVSYPAPTALAATMMPQYYLQTHGVDVTEDLDNRYVGSQESSIMNVYLKQTSAASTWPLPWIALSKERPELADELEVKWSTPPLINNGLVAKHDIPNSIVEQVANLTAELHLHPEGVLMLEAMALSQFELATNEDYLVVDQFLIKFNEQVRPIN